MGVGVMGEWGWWVVDGGDKYWKVNESKSNAWIGSDAASYPH